MNPESSDEAASGWQRRRHRRVWLITGTVAVVLAAAMAASFGFGSQGQPEVQLSSAFAVVQVKRETLIDYVTVDGEIGYGRAQPLTSKASGTVTWLPTAGTTVERGQPMLRVDDQPVVLLYGDLPMYRTLAAGTKGADVAQLETNLQALGYSGFTVDQEFATSTATAVKRWQRDLGLTETGSVEMGRVIFAAGALRVAEHLVRTGANSPADVYSATGTTKMVVASIAAADAAWAVAGAAVTINLPEGKTAAGQVVSVEEGTSQQGASDSTAKLTITFGVADQQALAPLARGALTVRHALRERKDVLTVPVSALLALAEGGYGLEIVDGGASRIVAVQVGLFAAGKVEVSGGGVQAGMSVRLPQ